ncbi:uncharacterized protein LOC129003726 [Macrosteles quadrilineatus]|uniref:uncharacterized protein LOC129003726 n=1 Tax=Macrosteles quadrilineatus TaxID=74068 RepID=UPI0023E0DFC6|nr:uncharacterized protein LOC129003726 [Macrosteles quadrilineatus]
MDVSNVAAQVVEPVNIVDDSVEVVVPVNVLDKHENYVKKFRIHGINTVFKFSNPPPETSEIDWLRQGFGQIVNEMKEVCQEGDQLGFTLRSLNLKREESGFVTFRPANEVNEDVLWQIFGGIVQSNAESIKSTDTFQVECTRVNLPVGKGRVRPGLYNTFDEECKARRGIVVINNKDNLCLPRALVVAIANVNKDPAYDLVRMDKAKRQTVRAQKLVRRARVELPEGGAGIAELEKFQDLLKDYKITVYNYNAKGRDVYFEGNVEKPKFKINLLFHNRHYNVITSLTAAFVCNYFCDACHIPYDHKGKHRCSNICSQCQTISPPCVEEHGGILCPKCNMTYKNQRCFIAHQADRCKNVKKCLDCEKLVWLKERSKHHKCGEEFCNPCRAFKDPNHKCYMNHNEGKPKSKDYVFIFFDLETRQDEFLPSNPESKVHKVNLCVSQQFCYQCIEGKFCIACKNRTRVFDSDPINQFMNYVMYVRKQFKNVCVIAHNGQGFDFQFLLKYLLEETKFTPELVMRGTKIILMKIDNVRFVDSLSYFPMALSALPKAFDLPPEKKKGYFPHLFNTLANQNYVGPMPAKEYYCPESMFEKSHNDFDKWYSEQVANKYEFNFKKELLEYCMSDVDILAQACLKFRSIFLKECNVDPFLEAVTIASACNLAFRRNFLKPNTIGIIPKNGYRLVDNQSAIALQWLSWVEETNGIRIDHAGRGKEVKVNGMKVDGFDGRNIYEFQGCYWHGCPKCFPYDRYAPLKEDPSDSLHLRYERTKAKNAKFTEHALVEMWECEFRKLKKDQKLNHLDSLPILNNLPLDPRQSFFGGRTGNAKSYHKCAEGETIQYVDVCSLYPYVCKYGKYPVGHPTIYVGDKECRERGMEVDGLLKCKVLPPCDLYHPVLPAKMNDKLMFVLCRTCGEMMYQGECNHDSDNRALVGTWTMDEIRKAVEKGYIVLNMYELWEYQVATYENGGLFTDFINKFLKMKQEASGYPEWCKTEKDKNKYITDYLGHEGIKLEKDKIVKNGGLRSLAKLMLNSFWGKFGQRENQTKATIVRDSKILFQMFSSPEIDINRLQTVNDEVVVVSWEYLDEVGEPLSNVNVCIAAYTTAQARLKLYDHLEALGVQVLYYDTDSVIFYYRQGLYRVPTGDYLGEMTDELADYGPGSYITELVSGGPKTYAYLVWSTNQQKLIPVCKIKGLTLNFKTSRVVNFEKLREMILSEVKQSIEIEENRIRRTRDRDIVTITESKVFKITGPKRRYEGEYDTLPFGYRKVQRDI